MNNKLFVKQVIFYLIGMIFIGFGVTAIFISQLGAGAFDAFVSGLAGKLNLTVGFSMNVIAITFLLLAAIAERKIPRFLSLITSIVLGLIIDFWMIIVFPDVIATSFLGQWGSLLLGGFAIAVGVTFMISSKMPLNPTDVPMIILTEQFNIPIGRAKLLFDFTMLVLAFLVSGPIGIGTIIITLALGPIIGILSPYTERLITR